MAEEQPQVPAEGAEPTAPVPTPRKVALARGRVAISLREGVRHLRGGDILDDPHDVQTAAGSPHRFELLDVGSDEELQRMREMIAQERREFEQRAKELGYRVVPDR